MLGDGEDPVSWIARLEGKARSKWKAAQVSLSNSALPEANSRHSFGHVVALEV